MVLIAQKSKKEKRKKENNSGGKTKIDDYFGSKYKKESCVFKIFPNVFYSRPVPDYRRISMFVFRVPKVRFSQSEAFNFQHFLGKHALEGTENSRP